MKKKIIFITLLNLSFFGLSHFVFADTSINLEIKTNTDLFNQTVLVSPCDSDNDPSTSDTITPYCAIKNNTTFQNDWSFGSFGAFLNSLNNISGSTTTDKDGNPVYHYWSWSLNGSMAMEALNVYELKEGDFVLLEFIDPQEPVLLPEVLQEPVQVTHSSSGSYVIEKPKPIFNKEKAIKFLELNQKKDGSFGDYMYTDWVAIGIGGSDSENFKMSLSNYLKSNSLKSEVLTDNERHAMALMSLSIDPYNGTEINYIKKIVNSFDSTQFGDKDSINDDIFALIVLQNAGYTVDDELIKKDISYLISRQNKDGDWGSIDMTAAGIQALSSFKNIPEVSDAVLRAGNYLMSKKQNDNSFGNSFSTSWVLQSMIGDERFSNAEDFLTQNEQSDGGMENTTSDINTRIWSTATVLPAIYHKTWNDILFDFPKQNQKEDKEIINKSQIKISKNIKQKEIIDTSKIKVLNENKDLNENNKKSIFNSIFDTIKSPFLWIWSKF